jgi:hypothetical protein
VASSKQVLDIIGPLFGAKLAEGMLQLSCNSLKIDPAAVRADQMPALAADLQKRMAVFLGAGKAAAIAERIAAG